MSRIGTLCLGPLLILAGCAGQPSAVPAPLAAAPPLAPPLAPAVAPAVAPAAQPSETPLMTAVDGENNVFFSQGASTVDALGEQTLQRHALRLKGEPKLVVTLTGYTDDQGSRAYNLAIAELRVNAVYQLLRRYGVPSIQLRRYGVGGEKVSRFCRSAECRQTMRRVELVYPK